MIPRRVELTNFLSFGDRQALEFTDDEPLWVLCGANGVGKSAVFDAVTFALFGEHRGGAQNFDQLIRHGANSFLVVFEFEFNGTRYEVHRGRDRRAVVQRVRRWVADGWEDVDLSAYPGRDRIRGWAEATLGLKYEAFIASVMLKQGEADRIITAKPRDRLDFLRQIIGAERYERLHGRVHTAHGALQARLDAVTAERDRLPEVTPAELEDAAAALDRATEERDAVRAGRDAAAVRVEQARRWYPLERDRAEVEGWLRAADARAADGDRIRADHARFEELGRVLPAARELVGLRDRLKQLDADVVRFGGELKDAETARDAAATGVETARKRAADLAARVDADRRATERLREEIDRTRKLVALADEVADLEKQDGTVPTNLDTLLSTAEGAVRGLTDARQGAGERRATAADRLRTAEERRRQFDDVEVGGKCLRCGQPVSEEHARRERAELDADIARHRAERDAAQSARDTAETAIGEATRERDRLASEVRARDRVRDRLDLQRLNLAAQGSSASAAELRSGIEERTRRTEELEAAAGATAGEKQEAETAAAGHEAERRRHSDRATELNKQLVGATTAHTRDAVRRDTLLDQFPAGWRNRLPALTTDELARDQADLDGLRAAGIIARFRELAEDETRREGWEHRRSQISADAEGVPPDTRCPVADAERAARAAGERLAAAEAAHAAARDRDSQLRRDADRFRELTDQHRDLDRRCRLHAALAELLGPHRLQRDLVRTAEREIVRCANETVRNLSRGDLTVELDDAEDGPDRAFALRVRRADDPTPIGVAFLSGSQKFRVAVAVALAIGRFATGQARPLESVIIDEGFGSLDRDGLTAMGDELRNLQQSQLLRRLILVSHQEEFTARFPVGYRLEPGVNGTTAAPFRREGGGAG